MRFRRNFKEQGRTGGAPAVWRGTSGGIRGPIFLLVMLCILLGALYFIYSGGKNLQDVDLFSEEGRQEAGGVLQKFIASITFQKDPAPPSAEEYARGVSQRPFTLADLAANRGFWPVSARLTEPVNLNNGTRLEPGEEARVMFISADFIRLGRENGWVEVPMEATDVEASVRQKLYDAALAERAGSPGPTEAAGRNTHTPAKKPPQSSLDNTVLPVVNYAKNRLGIGKSVDFDKWSKIREDTFEGRPCWSVNVTLIVHNAEGNRVRRRGALSRVACKFYLDGNDVLGSTMPDL